RHHDRVALHTPTAGFYSGYTIAVAHDTTDRRIEPILHAAGSEPGGHAGVELVRIAHFIAAKEQSAGQCIGRAPQRRFDVGTFSRRHAPVHQPMLGQLRAAGIRVVEAARITVDLQDALGAAVVLYAGFSTDLLERL